MSTTNQQDGTTNPEGLPSYDDLLADRDVLDNENQSLRSTLKFAADELDALKEVIDRALRP